MRRALVLFALSISTAAPAVAAPALRLADRGPAASALVTDGQHLIGWSTYVPPAFGQIPQGSATLLDLSTGARLDVQGRQYCYFTDLSIDDDILWSCSSPNGEAAVIDDPAGHETVIAPPATLRADYADFSGLGRYWLRVTHGGHHYSFASYVNRVTGRQVRPDDKDRFVTTDVNSPQLTRRLCRGMWRPMVPDNDSGFGVEPGPLAIAGRTAAATTHTDARSGPSGKVVLQRCGRSARVLQRCKQPVWCTQPVISDRIVAWARVSRRRTTVYLRSLRTGLTRSRLIDTSQLYLLGDRLFTIATPSRLVEIVY